MKSNKAFFILPLLLIISACSIMVSDKSDEIERYKRGELQARDELSENVQVFPEAAKKNYGSQVKVALLLPLSGKHQKLGQAMLDAAHLAISDLGNKNISIISIDAADDEMSAINAVNKAINEKVSLIVGPVFSGSTSRITQAAYENNINVISFSNDKNLLNKGAFLIGFMPEQQIQKVVDYSINSGVRSFSAFLPADEYGKMAANIFANTLAVKGLQPVKVLYYKAGGAAEKTDVSGVVDLLPVSDAIFIPEAGVRLKQIAETIKNNSGGKKIRILGSGQWDDYSTMSVKELSGSIFATSPILKRKQFEERFADVYGYTPPRITSLAYDAMALSSYLSQKGQGGDFSREALTSPRGFSSSNGIFRFLPNGSAERGLSVVEVNEIGFKEVEPAPSAF